MPRSSLRSTSVKTVKVNKSELITALRNNQDRHRATYQQALANWQVKVIKALTDAASDAQARRVFKVDFDLPKPVSYSDEYERAIGMLKMHVEDTIELDLAEYRQYIQDDWGWKHHFTASTSQYLGN